jgi:hypothetical protein
MKTKLLLPALLTSALLALCPNVKADDDQGDSDNGDGNDDQSENCQGGDIDGSETLVATVTLVASTNAPSDVGGVAKLISKNDDGVVTSSLSLFITNLTAGVYDVSAVKKSDNSSVDLGQFSVGSTNHGEGDDGNDDGDDDGNGDDNGQDCHWAVFLDPSSIPLPSDLDPMDIAQILISDTNGVVLLTGDFVNPATNSIVKFRAKIRAHFASSSPSQNGKVLASTTARKGKRADRFTMLASGLPANTTFSVSVNGQKAGTVTSNQKGKVLVRQIPANLLVVRSVHLIDANGNTALRAKF